MQARNFVRAADQYREAESRILERQKESADDLMYIDLQGYQHKNWAMLEPDWQEEELD